MFSHSYITTKEFGHDVRMTDTISHDLGMERFLGVVFWSTTGTSVPFCLTHVAAAADKECFAKIMVEIAMFQ